MKNIIEFNNVYKSYKIIESSQGLLKAFKNLIHPAYRIIDAISNLSFTIAEGELIGLIGENGAGKSTVVKLATGVIQPDSGQILFNGLNIKKHQKQCAQHYGVTFGQRQSLWWLLSAREGMHLLAQIYQVRNNDIKDRVDQLIKLFELEEFANKPMRQMSLGQRVRCEVASCFIHRPKIVFLDEPTIGMDALSKVRMREYLKLINKQDNVSVVLTSHDLFDVERVCERILILENGKLIIDGPLNKIRQQFSSTSILTINLAEPANNGHIFTFDNVEPLPIQDPWKLSFRYVPSQVSVVNLIENIRKKYEIVDFTMQEIPIDEFIAEIYKSGNTT